MTTILEKFKSYEPKTLLGTNNERPNRYQVQSLRKELISLTKSMANVFNPFMGFAVMILTAQQYLVHAPPQAPPHAVPVWPGIDPPPGANAAAREDNRLRHTKEVENWKEAMEVEAGLKLIIIKSAQDFIQVLNHHENGYDNVSAVQMMTHLEATYGAPTRKMLKDNLKKLDEPYNPDTTLIETAISTWENIQQFAAGVDDITDQRLINAICLLLQGTKKDIFIKAVTDWDGVDAANRNWAAFKIHIHAAFTAYTQTDDYENRNTSAQLGYHSANSASTFTMATKLKRCYCYTCGLNFDHPSQDCTADKKKPWHKNEATLDNMMGGSRMILDDKTSAKLRKENYEAKIQRDEAARIARAARANNANTDA
jgi:hypothetical protein